MGRIRIIVSSVNLYYRAIEKGSRSWRAVARLTTGL